MKCSRLDPAGLPVAAAAALGRALHAARVTDRLDAAGNAQLLARPLVAIAGSREAAPWSLTAIEGLAGHLAAQGACIVSGGAVGTDEAAHRGALQAGGSTIIIPPLPLADIDPSAWRSRLAPLLDRGRTLFLSPFPRGTRPSRSHPILRNRLIVALAAAAVAGETGLSGGTNHFLHCALFWGLPVYFLDTRPKEEQLRVALETLEQRGATRFTERDAMEAALPRQILAAVREHERRRDEEDGQQMRLCEDEEFYAAE